jgi:hypothetical protein
MIMGIGEYNKASLHTLACLYCNSYKEEDYEAMRLIQNVVDLRLNNSFEANKVSFITVMENWKGHLEEDTVHILFKHHVQKYSTKRSV